jgi:hypothetical protein
VHLESVSAANFISVSSFCFSNLCFRVMVKETRHYIDEVHYFMHSRKNPQILDFSWLGIFWKKVKDSCTLSLPWERNWSFKLQKMARVWNNFSSTVCFVCINTVFVK